MFSKNDPHHGLQRLSAPHTIVTVFVVASYFDQQFGMSQQNEGFKGKTKFNFRWPMKVVIFVR